MFAVEILIPLSSNQGQVFAEDHHTAFEAFVLARFGGVTRLPGTTVGAWQSAGVVYHDACVIYLIAVASITDGKKLGDVIAFAKTHYAQEAILVRYLGVVEVL